MIIQIETCYLLTDFAYKPISIYFRFQIILTQLLNEDIKYFP